MRKLSLVEAINHATALVRGGKLDAAERLCLDILEVKPDDFDAAFLLGMVNGQRGDQGAALAYFDRVLQSIPRSYEALYNRSVTLQSLGRHEEAIGAYDRVLSVKPDCADSLSNRADALQALNRYSEAVDCYDKALLLKPAFSQALNNRGNALLALKRHDEALDSYDRALRLEPNRPVFHNHRGVALEGLQRYSEALASYDQAISLKPDYAEALSNRGVTLQALQRHADAMESYDKALSVVPDYADALWNKSLLLLAQGEFSTGWPLYELRHKRSDAPPEVERAEPLWQAGESIRGKRILLYAEQGLGDTIQFSRYAKMVSREGATVVLEVPQPLVELLHTLEGVSSVIATGTPAPHCDFRCPLVGLPLRFNTSLITIPAETPYLRTDRKRLTVRSGRQSSAGALSCVLAWHGRAARCSGTIETDRSRSRCLRRCLRFRSNGSACRRKSATPTALRPTSSQRCVCSPISSVTSATPRP